MLNIIPSVPSSLKRFSKNFRDLLNKSELENFQIYTFGLYLELKRKNLQAIDNCRVKKNYPSLHHFLSESPWNEEKVNERRIDLIQKDRRTRTSPKGALIIDDTGCKKTGIYTEGAAIQYLSSEKHLVNCNTVVTSHYIDEKKGIPINLSPYVPADKFEEEKASSEFHTKIELAKFLIRDAVRKGIQFREVLFDSWYFCRELAEFCESYHFHWFSSLKENTVLYRKRTRGKVKKVKKRGKKRIRRYPKRKKKLTVKELVEDLSPFYFQQIVKLQKDGKEQIRYIYGANFQVSPLKGTQRVVISKPNPYTTNMGEIDVYVTDDLSLTDREIVLHASRRSKIDEFYRDIKDNLGFDQYQVRSLRAIKRHWYLVFLAYTYLKISNLKGAFQRVFKANVSLDTFGDLLRAFRKVSFIYFSRWLQNHYNVLFRYLQVKEPVFT